MKLYSHTFVMNLLRMLFPKVCDISIAFISVATLLKQEEQHLLCMKIFLMQRMLVIIYQALMSVIGTLSSCIIR